MVTNMVKDEFKNMELHNGGGAKPHVYSGYPVVKKKLISMGIEGIFFLTFGFKDEMSQITRTRCSPSSGFVKGIGRSVI